MITKLIKIRLYFTKIGVAACVCFKSHNTLTEFFGDKGKRI